MPTGWPGRTQATPSCGISCSACLRATLTERTCARWRIASARSTPASCPPPFERASYPGTRTPPLPTCPTRRGANRRRRRPWQRPSRNLPPWVAARLRACAWTSCSRRRGCCCSWTGCSASTGGCCGSSARLSSPAQSSPRSWYWGRATSPRRRWGTSGSAGPMGSTPTPTWRGRSRRISTSTSCAATARGGPTRRSSGTCAMACA